ncbi:GHKL domain-containing protein [Sellimonas intestinalis]|uniref:GHKL domain-containing protein n=1 Tax=Sellimonas intestinalis TaxID=1653434 RepID=UPI003AB9B3B7
MLCSKKPLIQQFNIEYAVYVSVPTVLPFDNVDLCIIIRNTLANAFESVPLNKIENPFVSVNIQYKNNTLYCHFQDTYVHKLYLTANFLFKSTKSSSHHGYGLLFHSKNSSKYNGICKISTDHKIFDLKVFLYLTKLTSS